MDQKELRHLIEQGESTIVQFKVKISEDYKLATEMVAFANTKGGTLIIGISDVEGSIIGLTFEEIKTTNQLLANAASDNVKAPIYMTTETVTIDGKNILIAIIPEGLSKPHFDNKGIIWIKNGSDKRKVTSKEEIARLLQSSKNLFADETIVEGTSIKDINTATLNEFISKKTTRSVKELKLSAKSLLSNLGMLRDGQLTLGGLLLFSDNPQRYKPLFSVHCISFYGDNLSSTMYRDKEEPFTGNLAQLYGKTMAFLNRNLKKIQKEKSFNSLGVLEVALETLDEVIVNALVHRDYFTLSTIKVFIFDSRIEVISPGVLANSLTVQNIRYGTSIPRNPILFTNARYFMPFVGVGSGIPRAIEKSPDLELINDIDRGLFTVIIHRPKTT